MGNKCPKCGCSKLHYGDENFDWETKELTYWWTCIECEFDFSDVWKLDFKQSEDDDGTIIDKDYDYSKVIVIPDGKLFEATNAKEVIENLK
jgi:hypothetical protein